MCQPNTYRSLFLIKASGESNVLDVRDVFDVFVFNVLDASDLTTVVLLYTHMPMLRGLASSSLHSQE